MVIQCCWDVLVDFNWNWIDYCDGFGNINFEFWFGNEIIYKLIFVGNNVFNIKLMDWIGIIVYVQYLGFFLDGELKDYIFYVGIYLGMVGMFR